MALVSSRQGGIAGIRAWFSTQGVYYLLLFVCTKPFVIVMSAPILTEEFDIANPCGISADTQNAAANKDEIKKITDAAKLNANVCYNQSIRLKDFVVCVHNEIDEESYQDQAYLFLEVPNEDPKKLNDTAAIRQGFHLAQRFYIVLNEMLNDYTEYKCQFGMDCPDLDGHNCNPNDSGSKGRAAIYEEVKTVTERLKQLLCSFQELYLGLDINPLPPPTPDIIPEENRVPGDSAKIRRNYIYVKQYVKAARFFKQLLKYVGEKQM